MEKMQENQGHRFAESFVSDIKNGKIKKDVMTNHFVDFTGGMEELYRRRFNLYMTSCGCFLMDMRLGEREERYHG